MKRHLNLMSLALLLLNPMWLQADPLDHWSWRNPSPTGNPLYAIAYGKDLFVAVGRLGTIVTSPDGINWTVRDAGLSTAKLTGIAYGNNQFVAVGDSGTILTSPDGITWTRGDAGMDGAYLTGIAYGNNEFVAVGRGPFQDEILTSPNGVGWSVQSSATFGALNAIAYGDHEFVIVGESGTVLSSADGFTWQHGTSGTTADLSAVTYGASQFVAVGSGFNATNKVWYGAVLTSPDGKGWSRRATETNFDFNGVAYGASRFVAVGLSADASKGLSIVSTDGVRWTNGVIETGDLWFWAVTYGNNRFVGVGAGAEGVGSAIDRSPDGAAWTTCGSLLPNTGPNSFLLGSAYGANLFVAVGVGWNPTNLAQSSLILTSPDGITWTNRDAGTMAGLNAVCYGNNQFVALTWFGTSTSPDGITWTSGPATTGTENLTAICCGNNQFVAVGTDWDGKGDLRTSADGRAWAKYDRELPNQLTAVAFGNDQFVVAGSNWTNETPDDVILTSRDGVTWTTHELGTTNALTGIAFGNGQFVAVGRWGALCSSDGVNWVSHMSETNYELRSIAYGYGQFVAAENECTSEFDLGHCYIRIVTSVDGVTWARHAFLWPDARPNSIAYGKGSFVAIGDNGTILQSGRVAPSLPALGLLISLPSGAMQGRLQGEAGESYAIQASSDLAQWLTITTLTLTNASGQFTDPVSTNFPHRFYRAFIAY